MGREYVKGVVFGLLDAVFRPGAFVSADRSAAGSVRNQIRQSAVLIVVYLANLLLYAGPLTLSGFGVSQTAAAPRAFAAIVAPFADPATAWALTGGLIQNSAFITVLSGLTLVTYHGALLGTFSSRGFVLTLHTVVYSVSAYLAGIFTILVLISQQAQYAAARDLVIELQVRFITVFYEAFGVPASQRLFTPGETIPVSALTGPDVTVLSILGVLVLYFTYSLYLGTRINHAGSRFSAVFALAGVVASPAIYITGLIVWSTGTIPI